MINTGKNYNIALEARFDRRQGQGCGMGRIGVTFGSRAEPLRDRAPNVVHIRQGLADPDPGGIAPPASTEIFRVDARPDLPRNDMFTVAIHISDGSVTNQVVALYVYKKTGTRTGTGTGNTITPPGTNTGSGTIVRLQSLNYPGLFIRHRNYLGELTRINSNLDRQDASFRIVPGLANRNLVSFESVNFPGYYLRHQGFRIKLSRGSNNDLFRKDATFKRVPVLANGSMVSFESYNYPGHYIRHRNFQLYLERGNTNLFRQDATFGFSAFGR
ncbi:MAG: AbfB domain-containing protein [Deltaproteobacteria bacterium]|nr:AbfB domain-containing protein [Deltaproteobacteria bacterium]MBW1849280.1 AbfB domain-containing protein [Deltaproteobacteria bacterium]